MEEKNFRLFMEFLKFLETEDLNGSNAEQALKKLAYSEELTDEQRSALAKEFPWFSATKA